MEEAKIVADNIINHDFSLNDLKRAFDLAKTKKVLKL